MVMSNMIGPMEQMALASHLFKGFYFMTTMEDLTYLMLYDKVRF